MRIVVLFALVLLLAVGGCAHQSSAVSDFEYRFDRMDSFLEMFPGNWIAVEPVGGNEVAEVHIARLPEFGKAFLVEEVRGDGQDRQFVLMMTKEGAEYVAHAYRITRPDEYAGAWKSEQALQKMSMYYLRPVEGCDIAMRWNGAGFSGNTAAGSCSGLFREDPAYVQTDIAVSESAMVYSSRGYDDGGRVLWGSNSPVRYERAALVN